MKRFVRGVLGSLAVMALPAALPAQTVFMVQLGTFDSEAKARAHWETLAQAFPDLFEGLNYVSGEVVMRPDNFVTYRTQAGPIATRADAEAVCDEVTEGGHECYVAETAMFYSDDAEVESSVAAASVPQTPQEVPVQINAQPDIVEPVAPTTYTPAPPVNVGVPVEVAGTSVAVPQTPTVPVAAVPGQPQGTGMIAVEEAIPVPLSEPQPQQNPYLERGNRLMDASPSDTAKVHSFWADIGYFANDAAAAQYVRVLKSRDSLLPSKLRIRIVRPYGRVRGAERLSLRMGPFLTTRPVRRLCALTRPEALRCRAIKDLGGSVRYQDRYSKRRAAMRGEKGARYRQYRHRGPVTTRPEAGAAYSSGQFYVQLGSFLSPAAAEDKWAELQGMHGRTLARVNKNIDAPKHGSAARRLFRLRAGPYDTHIAADELCGRLKAQGTLCIVVKR